MAQDSLECPFCKEFDSATVYIKDKKLLKKHFDDLLPQGLDCKKCGATAEKVAGCCRLRYVWKKKSGQKDYDDVAHFVCSDCESDYYARVVTDGGLSEIGEKVDPPPEGVKVRRQRMLCGRCQGKGGMGDLLNDLLKGQRATSKMRDLFG